MTTDSKDKAYLGDSVYVQLDDYGIQLMTDNGLPSGPSNLIYMEKEVIQSLVDWLIRNKLLIVRGKLVE